jgi:hypothetical protein
MGYSTIQYRFAVVRYITTSSKPTLTHVIRDDRRWVADVTLIYSLLFVLREPSGQHIQVYDTENFQQQEALQLKDFSDYTSASGLTSCVTNNCIYVSDFGKDTVHKVVLSGNNQVISWCVNGSGPSGLSVNIACNLLVACYYDSKILEYTASGSLVREICLESNNAKLHPYHAIQLTAIQLASDQFTVSYWNDTNKLYDVIEVDATGQVVVSYTCQLQSTTQHKFNFPYRLSVDETNEIILVADRDNSRIVILNRSLNCFRACEFNVTSVDDGLQRPHCLHFDISQNQLFVGERRGHLVSCLDLSQRHLTSRTVFI